jgi:putative protease
MTVNGEAVKLVVPVNGYGEVDALIEAGAGEFYLGYLDEAWREKYSALSGNRREYASANFVDFDQLEKTVAKIARAGMKAAVAMNDRNTEAQYPDLLPVVKKIEQAGIHTFIIADPGLLMKFKEWDIDAVIHISTGGGTFNPSTAAFYEELGAARIILPRQLTIDEMQAISQSCPGLEFELFGIYGKDPYMDCFCRFHHGLQSLVPGLGPCGCITLNETPFKPRGHEGKAFLPFRILNHLNVDGCCACVLPYVIKMNIGFLKIVGRGAKTQRKVNGVRMLKACLDFLRQNEDIGLNHYKSFCKARFKELFGCPCQPGNCYYYPRPAVGG